MGIGIWKVDTNFQISVSKKYFNNLKYTNTRDDVLVELANKYNQINPYLKLQFPGRVSVTKRGVSIFEICKIKNVGKSR